MPSTLVMTLRCGCRLMKTPHQLSGMWAYQILEQVRMQPNGADFVVLGIVILGGNVTNEQKEEDYCQTEAWICSLGH